jgi:hypothetical protein
MIELVGNLWTVPADARCITTNGDVRWDGVAVMGRGVAAQAKRKWPKVPYMLGESVKARGNHVVDFGSLDAPDLDMAALVAFPVKHHWDEMADPDLIARSCVELMALANERPWRRILLPRPGCGYGRLRWEGVKHLIAPLLDDRVAIVSLPGDS